jgi:hypothetical protein
MAIHDNSLLITWEGGQFLSMNRAAVECPMEFKWNFSYTSHSFSSLQF